MTGLASSRLPGKMAAFKKAFAAMSAKEQALLHDEARGRALRDDPTLKGSGLSADTLIDAYMQMIWEERQRASGPDEG
jgi:hypothetical protein